MFRKKESTQEKKRLEAVDLWGQFTVDEVERAINLNGIHECLVMFNEWDMEIHVKILKHIYL